MFNPKIVKPPVTSRSVCKINIFKQIDNVTNDNLLSPSTPVEMYNIHNIGGVLNSGLGIEKAVIHTVNGAGFNIPTYTGEGVISQIFAYPKYDKTNDVEDNLLIMRTSLGQFYKTSLSRPNDVWNLIGTLNYTEKAMAINYNYDNKDVMLFCSKVNLLSIYDGETVTIVANAPKISSMCEHYGRIFASVYGEGKEIWFSENYNPNNWSVSLNEAGYIKFSDGLGKAIKVLSFNDYLYVFREHAIFRLTAYGDQTKFELNKVVEINGNIYENSIVTCLDKIVFLCNDGLYIFDGFNIKKIGENIKILENIRENYIVADYFGGHYILSFFHSYKDKYLDETDFHINNVLLDYDVRKNQIEFSRGMNIVDLQNIKINDTSTCYVVANGALAKNVGNLTYNGKYYNTDLKALFCSVKYYFKEICRYKVIKNIKIFSKYNCNLTLIIDGNDYTYAVVGKDEYQEIKINKKCKWMQMKIETIGKAEIKGIEIDIETVRR